MSTESLRPVRDASAFVDLMPEMHKIERRERRVLFRSIRDQLDRVEVDCGTDNTRDENPHRQSYHRLMDEGKTEAWIFVIDQEGYGPTDHIIVNSCVSSPNGLLWCSTEYAIPWGQDTMTVHEAYAFTERSGIDWNEVLRQNPDFTLIQTGGADQTCTINRADGQGTIYPANQWCQNPLDMLDAHARLQELEKLLQSINGITHQVGAQGIPK